MTIQTLLSQHRAPVKIWADDIDDRSKEQLATIATRVGIEPP